MADRYVHGIIKGSVNTRTTVLIRKAADGLGKTGVAAGSFMLYYWREGAAAIQSSAGQTIAALDTAHTPWGVIELSNGRYRVDWPDAAFVDAAGVEEVNVWAVVTDCIEYHERLPLITIPATTSDVSDVVWDEAAAQHVGAGTMGAKMNLTDPWATTIPGAYGAGTAGKIVGDNLNAPVATVDTVVDAVKVQTDKLTFDAGNHVASSVHEVDDVALSSHAPGKLPADLLTVVGSVQTARDLGAQLDTAVSTRAPASTALSNTTWTDAKAGYLDVAVSSRSTLTAADVWASATRTLTSFGTLVNDIWAGTIETGYNALQTLRLIAAILLGKVSGYPTGPGVFRSMDDTANRVSATHDADGNRTNVTLTP